MTTETPITPLLSCSLPVETLSSKCSNLYNKISETINIPTSSDIATTTQQLQLTNSNFYPAAVNFYSMFYFKNFILYFFINQSISFNSSKSSNQSRYFLEKKLNSQS